MRGYNYGYHKKPPKEREKKKPATGLSREKIIRILIKQGILIEDKKKSKKPKMLEKILQINFLSDNEVEVISQRKTKDTKTYKISVDNQYGFIPKGWIPLTQDTMYELEERLGTNFDQGGYLRGIKKSGRYVPPIINLKTGTIRGWCSLEDRRCESGVPIKCYECSAYKGYFPSAKK